MLRLSFLFRHKVHDVGGNAHSFAFDTLTKVYRDAVYTKDIRSDWNPVFPEQEKGATITTAALVVSGSSHQRVESKLVQLDQANMKKENSSDSSVSFSNGTRRPSRRSGVQVEILALYRAMLKETQRFEDQQTRESLRQFVRAEFNKNCDIPRRLVTRIEWQLHHGRNKLEELRAMRSNTKFFVMH